MKKIILLTLLSLVFVSCGETNSIVNEYKITWKNDNGEILKVDDHVKEGTIPSFGNDLPTKASTEQYTYTFSNWVPEVGPIYQDTTFVANYTSSINEYMITWKNYDGTILKEDSLSYGSLPSYDGITPIKEDDDEYSYVFKGWSPNIEIVSKDTTYTATFFEIKKGSINTNPIISSDNKFAEYGFYPQSYFNNEAIISKLSKLTPLENNWYFYNNEYYTKVIAKVYNNEKYTFDDEQNIVNGNEYWFKCERIKWNIINENNGVYTLLSTQLLDAHNYYDNYQERIIDGKTIYSNNYEYSSIRNWLNNEFYQVAFSLNNAYIQKSENDNVSLFSYDNYLNLTERTCKTTDYSRVRGAWYNTSSTLKYNGSYWTKSSSDEFNYCAWNVNSSGYLSTYAVDGDSHCVRPSIKIKL